MNEIKSIDTIVHDPGPLATRRVTRKDEKLSDEEKERLLRKKRAIAKKRAIDEAKRDESSAGGDVDILV